MNLASNIPNGKWEHRIPAVYKIVFNTGHFYIGCSGHLRNRYSQWKILLSKTDSKYGNIKISEVVKNATSAELVILELCHPEELKDLEAAYMKKECDNTLMISDFKSVWSPVLQYTVEGQFVKRHVSVGAASRYAKTNVDKIQKVLLGISKQYKGMVFMYENGPKESTRTPIATSFEKKGDRDIIMISIDGSELNTFKTISHAARVVGCHPQNVKRVLGGVQKTAGGYIFKYA